jgi:hypothetical protein
MFEGPLDQESMAKVVRAGTDRNLENHILDRLGENTVQEISALLFPVCKGRNPYLLMNPRTMKTENLVYSLTKNMKPWLAFFTIWTTYLEQNGWKHSVDMEAHDIAAEMGSPVKATADGNVIFSGWTFQEGYVVIIKHKYNFFSFYKHNMQNLCQELEYVQKGQVIALLGDTGQITSGAHLHFEIWRGSKPVDPMMFVQMN